MQGKGTVNFIYLHLLDSDGLTTGPQAQASFGLRKFSIDTDQHHSILTAPYPKLPAGEGLSMVRLELATPRL